jgi:DNA-directed RNA polymerase specialized sigma subunit
MGEGYYYDVPASIVKAKSEDWGLGEPAMQELTARLGRKPTTKEIIAQAVEQDYEHLQAWCDDKWHWAWYRVTLLDVDGTDTEFSDSCGGYEYWEYDTAQNQYLFGEIMGAAENLVADAEKEAAAVIEWNERDVVTEQS